jgi:uncharacterized oligopeptide transporter (OPT) family protein
MPEPRRGGKVAAMNPLRPLTALLLLNAAGYVVALATGLADPVPGLLNGSKINAPLIIWAAQTIGVVLLVRGRRAGGALALLASTASLAAAAFDGDLAADGLGAGQVAIQVAISAVTAVLWVFTAVSLARYGRAGCGDSASSSRSSSSRLRRPRTPSGSSATT